jgi:hypothetical protein
MEMTFLEDDPDIERIHLAAAQSRDFTYLILEGIARCMPVN